MITVVTVLRSGGEYSQQWVHALRRSIQQFLPGATFRVLTDFPGLDPWAIPLQHGWPGWWSLVEWWRPGLFTGRVLAMGLDTFAVDDLSEIAAYDGPLAGISDFYTPKVLASGVMSWTGDEGAHIYETFAKDPRAVMQRHRRMDPWMRTLVPDAVRLQDIVPDQIVSFKKHARSGPPANARLVVGHGQPRFSSARAGWAHEHWKLLTARTD